MRKALFSAASTTLKKKLFFYMIRKHTHKHYIHLYIFKINSYRTLCTHSAYICVIKISIVVGRFIFLAIKKMVCAFFVVGWLLVLDRFIPLHVSCFNSNTFHKITKMQIIKQSKRSMNPAKFYE